MIARAAFTVAVLSLLGPCGKDDESKTTPSGTATPATAAASTVLPPPVASVGVPPGSPPADGSYEKVQVEGQTIPVIKVMEQGSIVLIDRDGVKPRTWEEEYKRKDPKLLPGQYDLHKTDVNKNGKFDDDPVDKVGLWVIDAKGNITKM